MENPVIGIAIHSVDNTLCFGTNTKLGGVIVPSLDGTARVVFQCPSIPLHEGRFDVTAAVHSWDESVMYHWLDRTVTFSVFQRESGSGLVDMSGTWTVVRQRDSPSVGLTS